MSSDKHALAIAYATKRKARKMSKGGGPADDEEQMSGDPETFLSDEEHSTPFHSFPYDESESSGLFDDNSMDNTEGNEDQNAARSGIIERIMRKVRMRNMGR